MGLAVRIVPSILCKGRTLVKGEKFNAWRSVGLAAQAVRVHQKRGVDEVCLLDVSATPGGRGPDLTLVEELSEVCYMPLAVGGGVRGLGDARRLLNAGADKIVIGTGGPKAIAEVANAFGCQAVVAAVDVRGGKAVVGCGKQTISDSPVEWAVACERHGAGEILLTSIEREGTMVGYDLALVREVAQAVSIPVVAHGGCKDYDDMLQAIQAGASAVAAGALFQFTDATPQGAARYLHQHGVEVRL